MWVCWTYRRCKMAFVTWFKGLFGTKGGWLTLRRLP